MLLEELLDVVPRELVVQLEVKAYADPLLARATAAAVARVVTRRADRRVEVLSFHVAACEQAASDGLAARLVTWADYAPDALAGWAQRSGVGSVCIEHFLLHPGLVACLRGHGLSVCTGTINDPSLAPRAASLGVDAITSDCPSELRSRMAAQTVAA